ncbi:MAG: HAD-IC family P-type ATPase [Ketobacteraceae bacterium]|nr:HAD-IC family P-type ATPase [Ketobacteraceae bacterium]
MTAGDQNRKSTPWHALSSDEVLETLNSSESGLSEKQAAELLEKHGPNRLRESRGRPWWQRLLDQFNNILILILLVAGTAGALLGHYIDAGAIFGVVLINAVVGFVQEGKAERALQSIKGMLSPEATVKRDGEARSVSAEDLVPGDVVVLEGGDRVPADLRLASAKRCRNEEAPLTGESEPVSKSADAVEEDCDLAERTSMAYAGTLCVKGTCTGVVVATAMNTEIGHISEMIEGVEESQTPLQKQLDEFGKMLAMGILAVAAAMGAYGYFIHGRELQEMFMAAVGLAVAAIPQGLPAIVTITLAIGVQAMVRRNAIIRQLPAVETLGSVSTIFTDKTGTLTRNEMTVSAIHAGSQRIDVSGIGFEPEGEFRKSEEGGNSKEKGEIIDPGGSELLQRLLKAGVLCNDSRLRQEEETWQIQGDPTEGALVVLAAKSGIKPEELRAEYRRIDEIPFDSEHKYMATLDEPVEGGERIVHVKGAPDVLLEMASKADSEDGEQDLDREQWQERIDALSSRGLRVLALGRLNGKGIDALEKNQVESDLVLLGLVGMLDPPRESVMGSVQECQEAGIAVKMVTGDHALTAKAIGRDMGLSEDDSVMTGKDIEAASDSDLRNRASEVSVFARAAPEHKLRLVEAVQSRKQVCAMTGDGVNDAPALKRADIGVAMGIQGSEASKQAAEMVLTDDNFSSIVNAVEEGRRVYANIRKTITFLLPTNGAESLAIMIAVLAGTMLPITPVQILWVNMVTAVTLGLALAFEPAEPDVMKKPPRDPGAPILDLFLLWRVLFVASLVVAPVYGLFLWLQQSQGVPVEVARSAAVNMLVVGEIVYLLNTRRSLATTLSIRGLLGNRIIWFAIGLVLLIQIAWTYLWPMQFLFGSSALNATHWILIGAAGFGIFMIVEIEKMVWRHLRSGHSAVSTA